MKLVERSLLLLFVMAACAVLWTLTRPVEAHSSVIVYIPASASSSRAVRILRDAGVVTQTQPLRTVLAIAARVSGRGLHRGSYEFTKDDTYWQVVKSLVAGDGVLTVRVTFPEGITLRRFASIVGSRIGSDSAAFLRYLYGDSLRSAWGMSGGSAEGYLMPDTYDFYLRQPVAEIAERLLKQQGEVWARRFAERAESTGFSKHQILTLASIVESETSADTDRARIAGVYLNRLRRGIKLAADPTVQYALGGQARRLLYRDLEIEDPYNTYRYAGLPPGPICAPGSLSIEAAIAPESHDFLYFCARGDGSGLHAFATTGAEHARNVARSREQRNR
ncbi:MAG: endolytic transglycosylase MltG [Candidatus Kapaibacterium sp.]